MLLTMNHAFEMLLKAIVLEKTGRIRAKHDKMNYQFKKCIALCQTQLSVLDENEALSLNNLNGFRDAAAHDLVEISEGLLYPHVEQAVLIFVALLKRVFNKELAGWPPRRILPLSTSLLREITAIIEEDMATISSMLSKGHRQEDDGEARLRPYQVMEKNIVKARVPPAGGLQQSPRPPLVTKTRAKSSAAHSAAAVRRRPAVAGGRAAFAAPPARAHQSRGAVIRSLSNRS
jgi:hypothetical protein